MTRMVEDLLPVEVLRGHLSPETAYVVKNLTYGASTLRCDVRSWIEHKKTKGVRFIRQVANPRTRNEWHHPHYYPYSPLVWMYITPKGLVRYASADLSVTPEAHCRLWLMGIYDQMNRRERKFYDLILRSSQSDVETWRRWSHLVRALNDHYVEYEHTLPPYDPTKPLHRNPIAYSIACAMVREQWNRTLVVEIAAGATKQSEN